MIMNQEYPIRKCDKCKLFKQKSLFYRYKYCKRCYIKDYIKNNLLNARIANHLNLSIDELNDISSDTDHARYDEVMLLMCGWNMSTSTIITDNVINNFLDE